MKPDIVIESKGQGIYEDRASSLQTVMSVIKKNSSKYFYLRIINNSEQEYTFVLDILFESKPENWEIIYYLSDKQTPDSAEEISPEDYELTIDAESEKRIVIKITSPFSAENGAVCFTEFSAYQKGSKTERDAVKAICGTPLSLVTDVLKEVEMFAKAETFFPTTATYGYSEAFEEMINQESDWVYQTCLGDLNGIKFDKYETAKNLIVYKVISRMLRKAAIYMVGGEALFLRAQENYEKEIRRLEMMLFSRYQ